MELDSQLARRMRAEWDRRVQHDYRFWMSDGVRSDEAMLMAGARDLELLLQGMPPEILRTMVAFELGCGVGRLLYPASRTFKQVIGLDVSAEALSRARDVLSTCSNVTLLQGNGLDLAGVADSSVDFAYSFAALGSMPVRVAAKYLTELSRILKVGGHARLQLYLGREQQTYEEDTIGLRAYAWDRFAQAVALAGFSVERRSELMLDFEISDHEAGLVAELVFLRKRGLPAVDAATIRSVLAPSGEKSAGTSWLGSETEYLMAVARAKQHLDDGNLDEALRALEFAVEHYSSAEDDVLQLLDELRKDAASARVIAPPTPLRPAAQPIAAMTAGAGTLFEQNMVVIRRRFPHIALIMERETLSAEVDVQGKGTGTPVVRYRGTPLVHPDKPHRASETWVKQTLGVPRLAAAENLLVVGFASGYQLAALLDATRARVHVVEPQAKILRGVLEHCDMRSVLERISGLVIDEGDAVERHLRTLDRSRSEIAIIPQSQVAGPETVRKVRRVLLSERGFQELRPTFGVVGPMWGGSLPIAGYTASALRSLSQRTIVHDVSAFYKPFMQLGTMVGERGRRDRLESSFVELLSDAVLERLSEHPVDVLICLAQAPLSPRALTEIRQRGIITAMWFVEDYQRFLTWKMLAPYFDYMFLIQRGEALTQVQAAGAGAVRYLPVGCDPEIHRPLALSAEDTARFGSALSFVGAGYNNRRHVFAHYARRDFKIWGTEWPMCPPFDKMVQERGRRVEPDEYVKVFNSSQININLHSSTERDGVEPFGDFVNPRTFELAACGAFQLVDDREYLPECFEPGREVATFRDVHELEQRIDYYLAHPAERLAIASAGRQRALAEHTYVHRLRAMLEHIYADRFEHLRDRLAVSPWSRTLREAERFPDLRSRFEKVFLDGEEPKLDSLVADIQMGQGTLAETEQKLLFLHHIRSQISHVKALRQEQS